MSVRYTIALLSTLCLATIVAHAVEVPDTGPATFYPDTAIMVGGQAACTIVHPDDEGYRDAARVLADALRDKYGVEFAHGD